MANTIVREYSKLSKVDIVGDYIVRAWREVYGVFANGAEVKIGEMCELLAPGTDLSAKVITLMTQRWMTLDGIA